MIVYHGSYIELKQIDLSKCEPHRDFGKGFYVTKFKQHAENWAKKKVALSTTALFQNMNFITAN